MYLEKEEIMSQSNKKDNVLKKEKEHCDFDCLSVIRWVTRCVSTTRRWKLTWWLKDSLMMNL